MLKNIVGLLILAPFLTQCSLLPPEASEILREAKSDLKTQRQSLSLRELPDEAVIHYLEKVNYHLSNLAHIKTSITVLSTDSIQALSAFESGEIKITRGMFNSMSDEAELAAVIAHEIGHKALKHKMDPENSEVADTLVNKGLHKVITDSSLAYEIDDYRRDLMWSAWSQGQERAADEFAVRLVSKAGYSPVALPDLLDRISKNPGNSALHNLGNLKSSHASLASRASHLRQYIYTQGIPAKGQLKESQFRKGLRSLVPANDSSDEISLNRLSAIRAEVVALRKKNKHISLDRFIQIVSEISQIARDNKISLDQLLPANSGSAKAKQHSFMQENLTQPTPFWNGEDSLSSEIREILQNLASLAVGFCPVVNEVAALYEVLSGKDVITGRTLSEGERALSAVGLMTATGTKWRTLERGMEATIEVSRVSRSESDAIREALRAAEEVREESKLYGRSRVGREYNMHIEKGPLSSRDAENFMGSKYRTIVPAAGEKFFRVGNEEGNWWTRTKPTSQMRSMSENAILPDWNDFSMSSEITIPRGFKGEFYEGLSA